MRATEVKEGTPDEAEGVKRGGGRGECHEEGKIRGRKEEGSTLSDR